MNGVSRWAVCGAVALILTGTSRGRAQAPVTTSPPAADASASWVDTPTVGGPTAGQAVGAQASAKEADPPDLTLRNFFTAGWNEDFTRRSSEDRAPDLALLRVQTNFMEREIRINYFLQNNIHSPKRADIDNLDYFIAYAFNRRFMLEVLGNYQWIEGRPRNPDLSGPDARLVGRVQLISTANSSYSFNFQFISPQTWLGQDATTISYGMAGFEDLTPLGLYRVGLYGSFLFDTLAGPTPAGTTRNDVQYDVTLAKTLTKPDTPLIGNFTLFVENFAQTALDGAVPGRTLVTITPGVRFNLGKLPGIKFGIDNWILFGTDIPVSGPVPWAATYRLTYIKNF
jgi:hypothetical protein